MNERHRDNRAAVVISIIVLAGFIAVCVLLFTGIIPEANKEVALIMFGGLNIMAGAVVNYWMGSSAGSSQKDTTINNMSSKGSP